MDKLLSKVLVCGELAVDKISSEFSTEFKRNLNELLHIIFNGFLFIFQ
ncbi:MAG: hypothetical protein IJ566_04670 [Cardiobacteriaceae bacterium]|nr:hypothetical protein [Cardiobacteriaceae bacterium]